MRKSFAIALPLILPLVLAAPASAGLQGFDQSTLSGNYLAGRYAGKLRDMDAAAVYFSKALVSDPDNSVLIERAFVLHLSAGEFTRAEEFATRVLGFNSRHRMARIVLGMRDLRAGHWEDARKNFAKSAYTPVGELTSALLTAWAFAGEKKPAEAMAALDALDSNETFANFKAFHAAILADFLGNRLKAEQGFKKAVEAAPSSLRVVQAYGNFLERSNRAADARKLYTAFLEGGDRNALVTRAIEGVDAGKVPPPFVASPMFGVGEAMFSLGSALAEDQGLEVALIYAQLAAASDGDPAVAHTLLGDILEDMERYEAAISAYDNVKPDSALRANAEIEMAVNLQRLERSGEAKARLAALIAKDPKNYEALVSLGNVSRANEDFAAATEAYTGALALVPMPGKEHWTLFYYRGIANERQKKWDAAEADFRKALALEPAQPLILNYLGYSLVEKKLKLDEAMGMIRKAVDLKPNDGYIVDSLGWAHFQLGEFDDAVKNLERASELKPADPTIADHLGDAYWRVGRKLEARFQWQHSKDNGAEKEQLKGIITKMKDGLAAEPAVKPAQNETSGGNG